MARIQKEKGGKLQHKSNEKTKAKKSDKKSDVLKTQIKSLGGNEADYDLVKDVDENIVIGTSETDVSYEQSRFLSSLSYAGFDLAFFDQRRF